MFRASDITHKPSMPRSKRSYVPPQMLAKGCGKKISGLFSTSKGHIGANSFTGTSGHSKDVSTRDRSGGVVFDPLLILPHSSGKNMKSLPPEGDNIFDDVNDYELNGYSEVPGDPNEKVGRCGSFASKKNTGVENKRGRSILDDVMIPRDSNVEGCGSFNVMKNNGVEKKRGRNVLDDVNDYEHNVCPEVLGDVDGKVGRRGSFTSKKNTRVENKRGRSILDDVMIPGDSNGQGCESFSLKKNNMVEKERGRSDLDDDSDSEMGLHPRFFGDPNGQGCGSFTFKKNTEGEKRRRRTIFDDASDSEMEIDQGFLQDANDKGGASCITKMKAVAENILEDVSETEMETNQFSPEPNGSDTYKSQRKNVNEKNRGTNILLDVSETEIEVYPEAVEDTKAKGGSSFTNKEKSLIQKKRGRNKCKEIARLKPGEKLEVAFYNNRAVGKNHEVWARHLGIIVRDTNMCPVRVHKWKDIGEKEKDHMWSAVTDVFSNANIEVYKQHTLLHMKELWGNWRSDLLRYNVTNIGITLKTAYMRSPPTGLEKHEWRWLIREIYSNPEFQKRSARNSANRGCYANELMHRTGSKPFRQVIWDDLGANEGNDPRLVDVFYTTRKKGDKLPNVETIQKHEEIQEITDKYPSLSNVEVAQMVFKSKSRDRVVGYGGGVKLKDVTRSQPSREELQGELNSAKQQNQLMANRMETIQEENNELKGRVGTIQEENSELKGRVGFMESRMEMFQDMLVKQLNVSIPS
ncbi:unnamed protein product [Cuscuta epithymum]|uniref:Uncharacterized protein n=1 Tax=Cuscuta epithymum TaxID=186058 RepID=A0AAV0FQQ3_9ASTE|nr:unnamed protein product [Cuscuta epithymum]